MLALASSVTSEMSIFFAVCILIALGPISFLSWLVTGLYASSSGLIAFSVLGYITSSTISILYLRLSLRRDGQFGLFFGIVGIVVWFFSGLLSFYPVSQM